MRNLLIKSSVIGVMLSFALSFVQPIVSSATAAEEWKAPARAARKVNPIPSDEKSVALGKAVYLRECLSCHGAAGRGDGPQAKDLERAVGNLSDPKVLEETDGALFWKISEGNKPMPTFDQKLTNDEKWQVINYLRTFTFKAVTGNQKK